MRIAITLILIIGLAWPQTGLAQQWLSEQEAGVPFQVALQRQMSVKALAYDSQAGFSLAGALPSNTAGLDVVEIKWPKSSVKCQVGVAQTAQGYGQALAMPMTYIAVMMDGGAPRIAPGTEQGLPGVLARICVWPTAPSGESQLVFLYTCSEGPEDSEVRGFTLSPDGTMQALSTQHALTLYGWFECGDLDGDGDYELVTSRSLDGNAGGFFYHAVRTFDPAQQAYIPQPESFREYFTKELAWLDWVVATRDLIQANPQKYMSQQEYGHIYTAEYEGMTYGFDTIIELPATFTQVADLDSYNQQRREALRLIREYRDQLRAWLDGSGAYPSAWKLASE